MNIWRITFYVLAAMPWLFVVSLLLFYNHATDVLGYAPVSNTPDPGRIVDREAYMPYINVGLTLWLISFYVWPVVTLLHIILKRKKSEWMGIVWSFVGQVAAFLLSVFGIIDWYLD